MKKTFFAQLIALGASLLFAASSLSAPPPEALAKQNVTLESISDVCAKMRKAFLSFESDSSKLRRSSGRDVVETLQAALRDSPIKDPKTLVYPPQSASDYQQIITTYNSLWRVETQLRPLALHVIGDLDLMFIPEKFHRCTLAFDYLNDESRVQTSLKDFNDVFEVCLATIRDLERNDNHDISGDEVLIASNMDHFFSVKGAPKGDFDRSLRVLDRYLDTLSPANISNFADDLNKLEADLKKLQTATAEINAWLATRQWNDDPLSVAAGYELLGLRVEQLIKDARGLLDKISSGSKCSQLRNGTFISSGIMDLSGVPEAAEGMPQYRTRSRIAFRVCRENYSAVAARLNERHKNDANRKPMRWQ